MNKNTINAIGVWVVRISLVLGAVYCGVNDKFDAVLIIGLIAFYSFIFLD